MRCGQRRLRARSCQVNGVLCGKAAMLDEARVFRTDVLRIAIMALRICI
jgi:hypothetical protein